MSDNDTDLPPERPGLDELLQQLNEQPISEIFGVVAPDGGGVTGNGKDVWTFAVSLFAWKYHDEPVRTQELVVRKLADDFEFKGLREFFQPYKVVQIRARLAEQSVLGRPDALLVDTIVEYAEDHELNRIAQQLQEPIIFDSAHFGAFTLNRRFDWFEAETAWGAIPIKLTLYTGEVGELEKLIDLARSLWDLQPVWDERIKNFAAAQLLHLKNEGWLQDDEKELTADDFKGRMTLESVTVYPTEHFEFWFDDGDLFWGHSIMVEANLTEGPKEADIHG